jgi:hypothetical protein
MTAWNILNARVFTKVVSVTISLEGTNVYKRALLAMLSALLLGCLFLLMPKRGEDWPEITRSHLWTAEFNLKQIVLAICNHNDKYGKLPSDILGRDSKPLLSWRVAILEFMEERALLNEFNFDEPWDGPNNAKLIEKVPKPYAPIRVDARAGETFYQTFTGKGTLFVDHRTIYSIDNIPGGPANTGLIFEAGEPVIWSKPADMPFDEQKPPPQLGGLFDGECHVALCDGSVKLLKKDLDENELKNLIMPGDGKSVNFKKLEK